MTNVTGCDNSTTYAQHTDKVCSKLDGLVVIKAILHETQGGIYLSFPNREEQTTCLHTNVNSCHCRKGDFGDIRLAQRELPVQPNSRTRAPQAPGPKPVRVTSRKAKASVLAVTCYPLLSKDTRQG